MHRRRGAVQYRAIAVAVAVAVAEAVAVAVAQDLMDALNKGLRAMSAKVLR